MSAKKVRFLAPVDKRDSGGPVYYRNADGTMAELINPWLKRRSLSVDIS